MSYACRLANRGYTVEQIFRALSAKPGGRRQPGSLKYQWIFDTKGLDAADRYARATAEKAVQFVEANPKISDRNAGMVRVLEIAASADALPWAIYGGAELRRSLEAVFAVARQVGSVRFGLAIREHAERAGHSFERTRANRAALNDLGWLCRSRADRPGRTSRFTLRQPSHIHSQERDLNVWDVLEAYVAHDAFRPGALGDDGWYILRITRSPMPSKELRLRTGYDEETLLDHLARLDHFGLLRTTPAGLVVHATDDLGPTLDAVAARRGTVGLLAADRLQYERDREAFRRPMRSECGIAA